MFKITLSLFFALLLLFDFNKNPKQEDHSKNIQVLKDSLGKATSWPQELDLTYFAGPQVTPSPACLAVAPTGEVFVGVDKIGSLGKDPGKGSIVKLIDTNNDGKFDKYTQFASVDNPRGIIVQGDKVYVLYTTFSKETGIATGMDLSVFEDKNQDGVADGPPQPLIQNISSPKFIQSRGTDHATNGIRMGIDGWIYIAVGDFGFHDAVDRSGTKLTMLGGGIVRVRPDGKEMEVYTHGLRNIYDVAIDPYMNIFTRGNTNDGGGWNIRFSHQVQTGEYGYPLLFKNFTEEIIPAMVDLGGGSGTGSLFLDDYRWPSKYNKVPMMADWGNSQLYIHRVSPAGASFTQQDEEFIKLPQITDLDIDGSGRLFLSAWDGAGYSGSPDKGFIVQATPKNWKYEAFPNIKKTSVKALANMLKADNAVSRLAAQQELLLRPAKEAAKASWSIAADKKQPHYARVAAIFTYAQIAGESGVRNLLSLNEESDLREFALRALTDRKGNLKNIPIEPFLNALNDPSPRVRVAATVGLSRMGRPEAVPALLKVKVPSSFKAPAKNTEGPHATPNPDIIPAHVAVQALVNLNAVDAYIKAIGTENSTIALWTLRYLHQPAVVNGLIQALNKTSDKNLKQQILTNLARLYKKEAPYEGQYWWSTRPDGHGPYYKTMDWGSSPIIKQTLLDEWKKSSESDKQFFVDLNEKNQMDIEEFGVKESLAVKEEVHVDLEKIKNKKGQIGESSIEDVMLAIAQIHGDPAKGKSLFVSQGCIACHSINKGEPLKGPYMGQVGSIMNREQIAESILKPNASISQGFASVLITTKNNKTYMGFVSAESADKLTLRDIAGQVIQLKTADILSRKELETSMMPEGLANSLSYEEFASLVTYLSQQKK
jgi:putative heme-binding domain-containing protein